MSEQGVEVLLSYLSPADTAAVRCVSRSWQALVDRCLTTLEPFAVNTAFFSLNSTPCMVYRSPFKHGSAVNIHSLDHCGPAYPLHAIAGQFTALRTLSIDCGGKACGDFKALRLMKQLRRLRLSHFSMADEAFAKGLGCCHGLEALHLDSRQAMLLLHSLRHLTGLSCLQELVLRPRGYLHVPPDSNQGVAALGRLTGLTQLVMLTALKRPRNNTSTAAEAGAVAGHMQDPMLAGTGSNTHPMYFSAAATLKLSAALGALRGLKVLKLTGVSVLPPTVAGLTQLAELCLERVGLVDRPAVASLCSLKALTGLTVITATDAADRVAHLSNTAVAQQQQQQQQGEGVQAAVAPGYAAPAAAAAAAAGAAGGVPAAVSAGVGGLGSSQGMWLPLLELLLLQEVVLGSAQCSQQLNLTGNLAEHLHSSWSVQRRCAAGLLPPTAAPRAGSSGPGGSDGWSWCGQGSNWQRHDGEALSVYVCPTDGWSGLSDVQGLKSMVVVRSWHSAAITAVFPSFAAAVAAFMTCHQLPAAAVPCCHAPYQQHPGCWQQQPGAMAALTVAPVAAAAEGAIGVFVNHPNQGCFIPSLPQLTVLAFQPCLKGLRPQQKAVAAQLLLQAAAGWQGGVQVASSQQYLQPQQQVLDPWRPYTASGSAPHCLLLAQLRASMHHSRLLLVLGASATSLTRLELSVDQSWPPTVLASLGQLTRLRNLAVLKLDCGRQQPMEEMWAGLSRLVSLRWLCLKWLDRLPVAHLAPLTNLEALQLKNIDKPPGVAQLAEVLHGMPHLTALAIEGALLDADEDWLRDMVGLMRHGRWTSSWVEHILCREYHLRVLGSVTAALLMSALLNSTRWPEMIASALMAAVAGALFVMAVAASLLQLLFDPQQARHGRAGLHQWRGTHGQQHQQQQQGELVRQAASGSYCAPSTGAAAAAAEGWGSRRVLVKRVSSSASRWWAWCFSCWWQLVQFSLLGGWLVATACCFSRLLQWTASTATGSCSNSSTWEDNWLSFLLRAVAGRAGSAAGLGTTCQRTGAPAGSTAGGAHAPGTKDSRSSSSSVVTGGLRECVSAAVAAAATQAPPTPADGVGVREQGDGCPSSSITDPGSAFRSLRFLSLRRCTLSHSNNSFSNKLWQLSVLASQLAPGLGAQLIAVGLAVVLWPLAVGAAICRITATSGSFYSGAGSDGSGLSSSGSGGYSYSRRSTFSAWAWGWDLVCGLLQGAADRVESAAVGCGPVVAVASCMPELRCLDVTWLNLEPWELHSIVQLKQLHYLGLSRQQVGVVMSKEAVFARNCSRNRAAGRCTFRRHHHSRAAEDASAGSGEGAGGCAVGAGWQQQGGGVQSKGLLSWCWWWLLAPVWLLLCWSLYLWPFSRPDWLQLLPWSGARGRRRGGEQQVVTAAGGMGVPGVDLLGVFDEWPGMLLVESPSGFDDVIEREVAGRG